MSKLSQVLLASVVLVLAILLAEQSLHLLYHALCWGANLLSGLRVVAFSLPEVFSPPGQQQISSLEFDQFVRRVEGEMVRLHTELERMQDREKTLANIETNTGGEMEDGTSSTARIENNMEDLRLMFHEYRDAYVENLANCTCDKMNINLCLLGFLPFLPLSESLSGFSHYTLQTDRPISVCQTSLDQQLSCDNIAGFVKKSRYATYTLPINQPI